MASNFWLDQAGVMPMQAQVNAAGIPALLQSPGGEMAQGMPAVPLPVKKQVSPQAMLALQSYLPKAGTSGDVVTDAYTDQSRRSLDDQKANLAGLNDYINQIAAKPQGINFTPLAAYVDSLTGSKLTAAAQSVAPQSAEEKDKMLFGLRNQLVQGQQKFSADQLRALQEQKQMQQFDRKQDENERFHREVAGIQSARGDSQAIRGQVALAKLKIGAGQEFEKNHIISTSKESNESLIRADSILVNENKPVTAKDLNLAYNDYINAVAKGGAATEGKIGREMPETYAQKYNEFQQKFGVEADLRKSPAGRELIGMLQENIRTVKGDINGAINRQTKMIEDNYRQVGLPGVAETVQTKMSAYRDQYPEQPHNAPKASVNDEAMAWAKANPNDPRAIAIIRKNGG